MKHITIAKWFAHLRNQTTSSALRREDGFTIVEAIVATLLMGVGVFGASTVFTSASRTTATSEQRSIATSLANAELEQVRALPYDEAAISTKATGYQTHYQGRRTVSNSDTTKPNRITPTTTVIVNDVPFHITLNLSWAAIKVKNTTIAEGYKLLIVDVRWTDSAGDHKIQHESGFYRGISS